MKRCELRFTRCGGWAELLIRCLLSDGTFTVCQSCASTLTLLKIMYVSCPLSAVERWVRTLPPKVLA